MASPQNQSDLLGAQLATGSAGVGYLLAAIGLWFASLPITIACVVGAIFLFALAHYFEKLAAIKMQRPFELAESQQTSYWTVFRFSAIASAVLTLTLAGALSAIFYIVELRQELNATQASGKVTARIRMLYTPNSPTPEIIESDNVLKPASFQWADDGATSADPKRVKWTLLVIVFNRPLTVQNLRILFEGGSLPYEIRHLTPRDAEILFEGSIGDKVIDVEAY